MNDFSYVEKLLDGVEVVWFPISEVTERTTNIKWSETSESLQYIDLTSVSVDTKKIIKTTEVKASNAPSRAQKLVKKDDVLFATTRPTQMRYCLIDEEYNGAVASTGYCVLRVKRDMTLPKWILHLISSSDFKKYLEENQSGSAYPAISDAKVKDFSIPIPCPDNPEKSLAIQSEIVRILDKFTALTAELTAELNMRKKQYNYYRDKLLSFEEGEVEWKTLGEICESITSGKNKDKSETGKFPVYGSTGVIGRTNTKAYEIEQILVARVGANAGRVNIASGKYDVSDNTLILKVKNKYNLKFLYYYLVNLNLNRFVKGAGQPLLTAGQLKAMVIPVPMPEEQSRIVSILDNFDIITNSIKEGLPREIELRQKQYEYYRDLLLSFPKSDEAA
ncbi:TPA: restriction endonuclease subunit S [Providencia stuartii]|uniref:restriction endonuclease subunit S n=1 Tax=Providencia stuartii TaxID=588 RepID=UPI002DBDF6C4|nr:restriction endonuclease subunit S [Providencia stuartii]WRV52713.1 restriction endonuclease subunit S [Providencia stuartii]